MNDASGVSGARPTETNPEDLFEALRDRPTPELDSARLWHHLEAGLRPRPASVWTRLFGWEKAQPATRLAVVTAMMAVVIVGGWLAVRAVQSNPSQLVMLTPGEPDATPLEPTAAPGDDLLLDVRLVRGYDGAAPADVSVARALGVGGADALSDVRARIETLLPFSEYGVVGTWQGTVADGDVVDLPLSDTYRLTARSAVSAGTTVVRLEGAELVGSAGETVSGDLTLEAGRLYLVGVTQPGAENFDLVLIIRARAGGEERR